MKKFAWQSLRNWTRGRRVTELLAALWLVALCDLVLTLWAHLFTNFEELNPVAKSMLVSGQYSTLVLFKITTTLIGTLVLFKIRHTRLGEVATWAMVLVYLALAIHWGTYTSEALRGTLHTRV